MRTIPHALRILVRAQVCHLDAGAIGFWTPPPTLPSAVALQPQMASPRTDRMTSIVRFMVSPFKRMGPTSGIRLPIAVCINEFAASRVDLGEQLSAAPLGNSDSENRGK